MSDTPPVARPPGLGSLAVCSWAVSMTYTVVMIQAFKYFGSWSRDPTWIRLMVILVLLLDTVLLIGEYGFVYEYCVTYWGDPNAASKIFWPLPIMLFTGPFTMTFVNGFLIHRFYTLSKKAFVSAVLLLLQIAALLLTIYNSMGIINPPTDPKAANTLSTLLVVATALYLVVDGGIAAAMLWQLYSIRTPFKETRSMINRLMGTIVRTGTATSIIALLLLIVHFPFVDMPLPPLAISLLISHFYVLTLLTNLNVRDKIKQDSSRSKSYTDKGRSHGALSLTEIHITQHRTVTTDEDKVYRMSNVSAGQSKMGMDWDSDPGGLHVSIA